MKFLRDCKAKQLKELRQSGTPEAGQLLLDGQGRRAQRAACPLGTTQAPRWTYSVWRRHGWRWIAHVAASMASWVCPAALVTALGRDSPGRSRCRMDHRRHVLSFSQNRRRMNWP